MGWWYGGWGLGDAVVLEILLISGRWAVLKMSVGMGCGGLGLAMELCKGARSGRKGE